MNQIEIFQIAINNIIPNEIKTCMDTVQKFAGEKGYQYTIYTEIPEQYKNYKNICVLSNYMRVDKLCENPNIIFFDWDIKLKPEFDLPKLGNKPIFNALGDNIMYSGDTKFWQSIRNWMGEMEDNQFEIARIFNALRSGIVKITSDMIIPYGNFIHLSYSQNKNK